MFKQSRTADEQMDREIRNAVRVMRVIGLPLAAVSMTKNFVVEHSDQMKVGAVIAAGAVAGSAVAIAAARSKDV